MTCHRLLRYSCLGLLNWLLCGWLLCGWLLCGGLIALVAPVGRVAADENIADEELAARRAAHFENEIRPVLVAKCIQCHGAKKQEGGLRLDSLAAVLRGGDSGEAMVVGTPEASLIIEALKYEGYEMPPTGQLAERTIAQFELWIAAGAEWPENAALLREESGAIAEDDRQWWAFQPVDKPQPPHVTGIHWVRNDIDRFVLKRLEAEQMEPAPPADQVSLVRRLFFDLLGLPPTPAEIAQFEADSSSDAWERLIDRLLDDPRYGEHWARHWLDVVRYSESDGWNQDAYRPEIWRYRDYVVDAFNSDKPYPEFVREQLAGDELPGDDPQTRIAAGFMRLGIYEYNQRDARGLWNDTLNELTDVASDVFLGMSLACARCHDHKFDPLPQRDYFALRAFFEPLVWRDDIDGASASQRRRHAQQLALWQQATADIQRQIDQILAPYYERKWHSTVDKFPLDIQACFHTPAELRTSWEEQMAYLVGRQFMEEGGGPLKGIKKEDQARLELLETQLAAWDELKPLPLPQIMTVSNHSGPLTPTTLPEDAETVVPPGFLAVLSHVSLPVYQSVSQPTGHRIPADNAAGRYVSAASTTGSPQLGRRLQLADWIGDPRNPLTTRVIVNRIWQQHFGEGLVSTSSDFGRLGALPSHPELLDWLTATFVEQGWSFKQLHKQILLSSTWQQAVHHPRSAEFEARDPDEKLLWRSRVRRLQAEQLRDAMLVASGELQSTVGGPSVDEEQPRRGLYVKSFRNNQDTFLHSFDMANGLQSVPVRDATTTPTQALMLFNGEYTLKRAQHMQQRLMLAGQTSASDPSQLLTQACLWTWGRAPSAGELELGLRYLGVTPGTAEQPLNAERFTDFCHLLLNSNEFLYLD